jgi:hypothetical protein
MLVGQRSSNFTAVARPAPDVYCLTLAAGIDATATSPVVSVDSAAAPSGLYAAIDTTAADCASGKLEVRTSGSTPSAVGFTILVP